ncbi:hypothetical protein ABL78_6646 [Leptomonas seymouri]|uniref:Uncharacterized protein n=1 Tax=Leptomonas seymouri TaxID=5684 RepID=A0A0N1HV32_LEPSE|nr:hypothetical protein ABL78_6646 [Leptomonas seymouri]|eukprot:KPI84303.1 hypothetical protein ABL78_6646 [Leptomonas seymouri]
MQLNQHSYSAAPFDRAADRQGGPRWEGPGVILPPIQTTHAKRFGASAPAGAVMRSKSRQQEGRATPRENAWDAPRAGSAEGGLPTAAYAAEKTRPTHHSVLGMPRPIAGKHATRGHSRRSSLFSHDSGSTCVSSRGDKDRLPPYVAAVQQLMAQVEREKAEANKLLCDGNVGGALNTLKKALHAAQEDVAPTRVRKRGPSSKGAAVAAALPSVGATPCSGSAAPLSASAAMVAASAAHAAEWRAEVSQRLAETYTVAANNAGVRCSVTAEPLAVQEAYFQTAMRYLVRSADENLFPEWKRPARPRRCTSTSSGRVRPRALSAVKKVVSKPKPPASYCIADGTEPNTTRCQLLRCAVRNNAAVCLADRFSRGGQARTIYELLKALVDARGVWGVVVLYNLAVSFLDVEHYDDAAEAIARCMELSYYYLKAAEELQLDSLGTSNEAAAAIHTFMALQLIRGHHFIATMATWCDPSGPMEVQQCEMALGCAKQYLSPTDAKQLECQRRLAAAHARATGALSVAAAPLLPYVTHDFTFPGAPACRTPSSGATDAIDITTLVEGLFSLSSASSSDHPSDLPDEVRAYVQAARKGDAMRFWVKDAQLNNAAPPFLSAAKARAPLPAVLVPPSTDIAEGATNSNNGVPTVTQKGVAARSRSASRTKKQRQPQISPNSRVRIHSLAKQPALERQSSSSSLGTQIFPTVYRPSKPAPYFVTTMPQSTFRRYRSLRAAVVSQLQNEEASSTSRLEDEESEEDFDYDEVRENDNGRPENTAAQLVNQAGVSPYSISGAPGRGRRMTALLYGAASTPPRPDTSSTENLCITSRNGDASTGVTGASDPNDGLDALGKVAGAATVLATPVRPSELLQQLDTETEACYSHLVGDPLADVYRHAATRLQSWWRARLAIDERRKRSAAVMQRCEEEVQAFRIQCFFRSWKRRQLLAAERERARQARLREERVTIVQAFLHQRESLEVWGRALLVWYEQLVAIQAEERRQCRAAVKLQSWWRMCAAWAAVKRRIESVIRLQTFWRGVCARKELQELRVRRRLAEEARFQRQLLFIKYVQRWWRACQERFAAQKCLVEKQKAVASYLADTQAKHDKALKEHLRNPDEAVAAMRTVLAVLAGARDRRSLGKTHRCVQIRKRAVHCYVLKYRGCIAKKLLEHEREEKLRLLRRREEVAVATMRLQKWARWWLPRRRTARLTTLEAYQNRAAAKIQALWRKHHMRQQEKEFSHFMSSGRHRYAMRIQRAWQAHRAQQESVSRGGRVGPENESDQQQEQARRDGTAVRIESQYRVHRTHSCEQRGSDDALPSKHSRDAAARRIQSCWRSHFTQTSSRQSPSGEELVPAMQKLSPTTVNLYATWIQAFARSFLALRSLQQRSLRKSVEPTPSPSGSSAHRFLVPRPPATQQCKGASRNSGPVSPEAETLAGPNAADRQSSRQDLSTLPGFSHTGASVITSPMMADIGRYSPSCSALQQSLSRLTGSNDKLLCYLCNDSTCELYDAKRVQRPSSSTISEYSEEEKSEEDVEEVKETGAGEAAHSDSVRNSRKRVGVQDGDVFRRSPTTTSAAVLSVPQTSIFPIPRPPVSQRTTCVAQCRHTPEEIAAATRIQAVWRGFRERCNIEYFYEEYYEEVDEEDEVGGCGEERKGEETVADDGGDGKE